MVIYVGVGFLGVAREGGKAWFAVITRRGSALMQVEKKVRESVLLRVSLHVQMDCRARRNSGASFR